MKTITDAIATLEAAIPMGHGSETDDGPISRHEAGWLMADGRDATGWDNSGEFMEDDDPRLLAMLEADVEWDVEQTDDIMEAMTALWG